MTTKQLTKYVIIIVIVAGILGFAIQAYRTFQAVSTIQQSISTPTK